MRDRKTFASMFYCVLNLWDMFLIFIYYTIITIFCSPQNNNINRAQKLILHHFLWCFIKQPILKHFQCYAWCSRDPLHLKPLKPIVRFDVLFRLLYFKNKITQSATKFQTVILLLLNSLIQQNKYHNILSSSMFHHSNCSSIHCWSRSTFTW